MNPSDRLLSVHVLSEHVFCPRAGLIASESGPDSGDEEPMLGPRLDPFVDYDEQMFVEELRRAYAELTRFLTWLAPASFVVFVAAIYRQPFLALFLSLPPCMLLAKCAEVFGEIVSLIRERTKYKSAPSIEIDLAPTEVIHLSWWSLRKAGFDCIRLEDRIESLDGSLTGKPWRILRKGNTIAAPVIRRKKGCEDWHKQHEIRIAAYCDLIENSEGGKCPFGVILFAGTSECVIIPNLHSLQQRKRRAVEDFNQLLAIQMLSGFEPPAPTDNRCAGCEFGRPREFQLGKSETVLNGRELVPCKSESRRSSDGTVRGVFHSDCGDRFRWVPPHRQSEDLGISQTR